MNTTQESFTQYRLLETLGEGAYSQVMRAERLNSHFGLTQTVAIKILKSENAVDMWRNEFESLARVKSPYCVQVFSFEQIQTKPALILEHVEGLNLRDLIQYTPLTEEHCLEIMAQVQMGLEHLSANDLSHGDLSPKNIMVDTSGTVRLLDFGLGNSANDQVRFTPGFCAPEILEGAHPTSQTDLYSLGAIGLFLQRYASSTSLRCESLMADEPNSRTPFPQKPRTSRRKNLARTVRMAMEKRASLRHLQTKTAYTMAKLKRPLLKIQFLIFAATFAFASSSQSFSTPPPTVGRATVQIRTQSWHLIEVDGRTIGYAPVDLHSLSRGTHKIGWKNAQGQGFRKIELKDDQTRLLTDADLQSY